MRRAFTLLELLVVVAIMGLLGTAATGAYSALQRGMAERGAVAVAASVLRAAQERAHVDRLPTAVFCYNRLLKAPTTSDDNGVAVGVMVAVRRGGRLSYVRGSLLFDEFADLDTTYEWVESEDDAKKRGSFRLYRFDTARPNRMEYSIVSDAVVRMENAEQVTLFSGTGQAGVQTTNLVASAFCDLGGGTASGWKVGDGYAFAFAEVQLPEGFVFGQNVPTTTSNVSELQPLLFDPDAESTETVDIWSTKPDAGGYPKAFKKAGTASADSERAV